MNPRHYLHITIHRSFDARGTGIRFFFHASHKIYLQTVHVSQEFHLHRCSLITRIQLIRDVPVQQISLYWVFTRGVSS
jgi:hypothetical protein